MIVQMTYIKPDYYVSNGCEAIDFIDAFQLSFCLGNVIKYIARAGNKRGEDRKTALYKAMFYLEHEIELEEKS